MSYRKIIINGRQWTYKIGRSSVHLRDPNGKGQVISKNEISALSPERDPAPVDPGSSWRDLDWSSLEDEVTPITPRDIKRWVETRSAV